MRSGGRPTQRGASRGNRRAIRCRASGETTSASWLVLRGSAMVRGSQTDCLRPSRQAEPNAWLVNLPSAEMPPVERDQALPMPLRGGLVVAPALREGEAVMDTGLEFDLADGASAAK